MTRAGKEGDGMSTQQEKLTAQIEKAKENLRRLQTREAELKKREKEQKKRAADRWYQEIRCSLDSALRDAYGTDYWERIRAADAAALISAAIKNGRGEEELEDRGGHEDH